MPGGDSSEWIVVTEDARTLPAVEVLTGRGFITGKSGSGKSNSASVIAEELLENSYNMLIIDPEGEYYGLKEQYKLLHVGADDFCDVEVKPRHAEKLAEIALERNMPVILDVSEYFDGGEAKDLIRETVKHLFMKEKEARKPFLLMVEEMQEYLPQQGGSDDLADLLERVAKRGRKRGLGVLGISQRPASVDKDFITQCDWMVWHKLTWENDINVASNILGSERASEIEEFEPGEAYLMTDWSDTVERVTFKRKRTHDAGATPGLESYERPDLHSVGNELIAELTDKESAPEDGAPEQEPDVTELDPASIVENVDVADVVPEGEIDILDEPDADKDDLRATIERLHRRNQILEDEVAELKQILNETDASTSPPFTGNGHDTPPRPSSPNVTTDSGRQPSQPSVPQPPPDRSGVAGNIIEFGQMILYACRLIGFRFALLFRSGPEEKQRPE